MPKKHCQSAKTRKRRGKDLDEIDEDRKPEQSAKLIGQAPDPDLPGEGMFYCIECTYVSINNVAVIGVASLIG